MKLKHIAAVVVGATLFSSCIKNDEFDIDKISSNDSGVSVNLPLQLGTANLTFKDLDLSKDSSITFAHDSAIVRFVINEDLFTESLSDLLPTTTQALPAINMTLPEITIDNISDQLTSPLGTAVESFQEPNKSIIKGSDGKTVADFPAMNSIDLSSEAQDVLLAGFTSATFSNGQIDITITNGWGFDVTNVTLFVKDVTTGAAIQTLTYASIQKDQSQTQSILLKDKTIGNKINAAVTNVDAPQQTNIKIDLSSELVIDINSKNLEIKSGVANIPAQNIKDTITQTLTSFKNGEEIRELTLKSGSIDYAIAYAFGADANIEIHVPAAKDASGKELKFSIVAGKGKATNNGSKSLAGYVLDLSAGGTTTNKVEAFITATTIKKDNASFNVTDKVTATITLKSLIPSKIKGYLGKQSISFPAGNFNADLGGSELSDYSIKFANPTLKLNIESKGIDVPLTGKLSLLKAENTVNGTSKEINVTEDILANVKANATTQVILNNTNAIGLSDALALTPNKFSYSFTGSTNPGTTKLFTNELNSNAEIKASMAIDISVNASVKGASLNDTIEFDLGSDADKFASITLQLDVENHFPIKTDTLFIYSADKDTVKIGDVAALTGFLTTNLDTVGKVESATKTTSVIEITGDKLTAFKKAKFLLINGNLIINNGKDASGKLKPVKVFANDYLKVSVGLKASVKL